MYLLIQINLKELLEDYEHLHSIMYLLIRRNKAEAVKLKQIFTFHNVSINSLFSLGHLLMTVIIYIP